jgi:ATP-dependent Clp protease ATP-binding subunit ClpA
MAQRARNDGLFGYSGQVGGCCGRGWERRECPLWRLRGTAVGILVGGRAGTLDFPPIVDSTSRAESDLRTGARAYIRPSRRHRGVRLGRSLYGRGTGAILCGVFERFTERARQVVVLAQEEARTLKHNYVGTEHILLGLLREEEGLAARVLEGPGHHRRACARAGHAHRRLREEVTSGQIPFTPRAGKVLELALREALSVGHNYVGTEHILLGLARENEGVGMDILAELGADSQTIRSEVRRMAPPERASSAERALQASRCRGPIGLPPTTLPAGDGVPRLFGIASDVASEDGRGVIEPRDVLIALTRDEQTAPLLRELGVDERAVRETIERRRTGKKPPQASDET